MPLVYPAGYDYPIASVARHLLSTIVDTYAGKGVVLPVRQLVTIGSVAVDSELLAVMFGGLSLGPPGNELNVPYRGESPRTASFNIELWRRTPIAGPSGDAPPVQDVSAAAETIMQDTWLLLEAALSSDQLSVGIIASAAVNPPSGGMIGVSLSLEITVP